MTKKKEITQNKRSDDSFNMFIDEFSKESDRAAVVLGAAKLDLLLYQILHLYLAPAPGNKDELLEGDSPLGTFSAKIHLTYRLGLIDSEITRSLHMVRKIRNSFAHEVSGCSLESGAHRDRVRELVEPFTKFIEFEEIEESCRKEWKMDGARLDFRIALAIIGARLDGLFSQGMRVKSEVCCKLIPSVWLENDTKTKCE